MVNFWLQNSNKNYDSLFYKLKKSPLFLKQKEFTNRIENCKYVIGHKRRHVGFSTWAFTYGVWKCLNFKNQRFLIVHPSPSLLNEIWPKPEWNSNFFLKKMRVSVQINDNSIKFINGNEIAFSCLRNDIPKDITFSHLIVDEFNQNLEKLWYKFFPNIKEQILIMGEPHIDSWFDSIHQRASLSQNSFKAFNF